MILGDEKRAFDAITNDAPGENQNNLMGLAD
jgi:hypothetical protein